MSASREKKQRQSGLGEGLTPKQRQQLKEEQAAKRKAVGYTVIGVVVAVLVIVLLVWHSGIFQRRATAVTVGGQNYTVNDVEYYFRSAMYNEYYFASMFGTATFDPSADLRTQYVDEEETQSYYDYFLEQALDNLTQAAALEQSAAQEGYTLSQEDKDAVEESIASTTASAEENGYPNLASFLKANYGRYMTVSAYRTCLERDALTNSYLTDYAEKQEVTQEDLDAYYDENAASLDSYDYRYIVVDGSVPETTDADGNTVEPTEEETAAAMQAAKAQADEFAAAVEAADDPDSAFIELAPDYVAESSRDSYASDPDRSLTTGLVGSSLSSTYGSWLKEDDRVTGDITVIEGTDSYYVVLFLDRYRVEDPTVDVRHILIKAETAEEDDASTEDVDESTTPTQEALDAAKAEAEDLLAQWEAGDKTADSFGKLAEEYSDDTGSNTNGGLYENVTQGQMFDAFDAWIFDSARQSGDTTLVENPQSGQQGWHVIYFQDWADPVWMNTADNAIRSQRQTDWLESLTEGLEAVQGSGIKYVNG